MRAAQLLKTDFTALTDIVRAWAAERGTAVALVDAVGPLTWAELDAGIDHIAARLQADGIGRGDAVAIAGANSIPYVLAFFGALRAGAAAALLPPSAAPQSLAAMLGDSGARHLFLDAGAAERMGPIPAGIEAIPFDAIVEWGGEHAAVRSVDVLPGDPFNIIYSSGTTGTPKGIVQSHTMRMGHMKRAAPAGFEPAATALYATPLYSNTTLVSFLAAVAGGSRSILMPRFDVRSYCEIAERERATHTILVPVQYQRLMDFPAFDSFDLTAFRYKATTSAPFPAELKREVLRRWPGRLVEFYGMTEGGASCVLQADQFPDKLHTVGQPAEGHDMRLIDEHGREVGPGEIGAVVGCSELMMTGYHNLPDKTAEAEWHDSQGRRFIRHGDLGYFDEDGFLILVGRAKDMIISGGFNIYPSDLEAELLKQEAVLDVAVVGAPSPAWGETPVAFVVLRDPGADLQAILAAVNAGLGKTQRISAAYAIDELPRSAIGKVLKRELRDRLGDGL